MTLWILSLLACDGEGGGAENRSYCEAVCDWAVACQATEREIDAEAQREQCLADTRAADASCADAEDGGLDPISKKALTTCVDAVDAAAEAGECAAYVGRIDDLKTGAPPSECLTQGADAAGTFEAARDATTETGAELCQRYTETYCHGVDECFLADFGGEIPPAAIDALGGTPYELCVQRLDPVFTADCVASDRFAAEASLDDVNGARQATRECLSRFAEITCEQIKSGDLPEFCAGAFTDDEQALAFGTVIVDLASDYAEYAP